MDKSQDSVMDKSSDYQAKEPKHSGHLQGEVPMYL